MTKVRRLICWGRRHLPISRILRTDRAYWTSRFGPASESGVGGLRFRRRKRSLWRSAYGVVGRRLGGGVRRPARLTDDGTTSVGESACLLGAVTYPFALLGLSTHSREPVARAFRDMAISSSFWLWPGAAVRCLCLPPLPLAGLACAPA